MAKEKLEEEENYKQRKWSSLDCNKYRGKSNVQSEIRQKDQKDVKHIIAISTKYISAHIGHNKGEKETERSMEHNDVFTYLFWVLIHPQCHRS